MNLLQLYSGPSGTAGEHGFRLTGRAKEGAGLCRVQLRHMEPWHRYPSPRIRSTSWDLRVYTRTDAAFVLETELGPDDLDVLQETYEFPDGAQELSALKPNGDLLHDRVLAWARKVTGADALDAPKEINPVLLQVRYKKAEAAQMQIPRIPSGRPLPPGQSPLILNAEHKALQSSGLKPYPAQGASGAGAAQTAVPAAPTRPAAPAAAAPAPAAPTPEAPAAVAPPPKPAGPPKSPTASSLTQRLQAIREQAEKPKDTDADKDE